MGTYRGLVIEVRVPSRIVVSTLFVAMALVLSACGRLGGDSPTTTAVTGSTPTTTVAEVDTKLEQPSILTLMPNLEPSDHGEFTITPTVKPYAGITAQLAGSFLVTPNRNVYTTVTLNRKAVDDAATSLLAQAPTGAAITSDYYRGNQFQIGLYDFMAAAGVQPLTDLANPTAVSPAACPGARNALRAKVGTFLTGLQQNFVAQADGTQRWDISFAALNDSEERTRFRQACLGSTETPRDVEHIRFDRKAGPESELRVYTSTVNPSINEYRVDLTTITASIKGTGARVTGPLNPASLLNQAGYFLTKTSQCGGLPFAYKRGASDSTPVSPTSPGYAELTRTSSFFFCQSDLAILGVREHALVN